MPIETNFVTNFIMIDRLLQMRDALERMVVGANWHILVEDFKKKNLATHEKCFMVRHFVPSNGYWHTCETFSNMVILVVKSLSIFDGKVPAMELA